MPKKPTRSVTSWDYSCASHFIITISPSCGPTRHCRMHVCEKEKKKLYYSPVFYRNLVPMFAITIGRHTRRPDLQIRLTTTKGTFSHTSISILLFPIEYPRTNRSCRHPRLSAQPSRSAMDPRTARRISARLCLQGKGGPCIQHVRPLECSSSMRGVNVC